MTDLKKHFAVIGNPIHHSLSPQIHAAFAKENGLDIDYESVLSPLDQFKNTMHQLIQQKFTGANVTLPFKKEATPSNLKKMKSLATTQMA
jgi:shikimate dehydrogenase